MPATPPIGAGGAGKYIIRDQTFVFTRCILMWVSALLPQARGTGLASPTSPGELILWRHGHGCIHMWIAKLMRNYKVAYSLAPLYTPFGFFCDG